jgi:hypothetical protein
VGNRTQERRWHLYFRRDLFDQTPVKELANHGDCLFHQRGCVETQLIRCLPDSLSQYPPTVTSKQHAQHPAINFPFQSDAAGQAHHGGLRNVVALMETERLIEPVPFHQCEGVIEQLFARYRSEQIPRRENSQDVIPALPRGSRRNVERKRVFDLVMRFGTSQSPKRTRSSTAY